MTTEIAIVILGIVIIILLIHIASKLNNTKDIEVEKKLGEMSERFDRRIEKNTSIFTNANTKHFSIYQKALEDVTKKIESLSNTNKEVLSFSEGLTKLQKILANPQQRGVMGEHQLQSVLNETLPPNQFELQYGFLNGERVDAVIFLDQGRILPVDAKFSLESYERYLDENEDNQAAMKDIRIALKKRIDETSKYIRPKEKTMDFAFMFIPSESLYYDLLSGRVGSVESRSMIEYAYQEKKVIVVSPTTFVAYLQTVLQGLRTLEIEQKAQDIVKGVQKLKNHLESHGESLQKVGKHLGNVVSSYNKTEKEFTKIDKDIVKLDGGAIGYIPQDLDKPNETDV